MTELDQRAAPRRRAKEGSGTGSGDQDRGRAPSWARSEREARRFASRAAHRRPAVEPRAGAAGDVEEVEEVEAAEGGEAAEDSDAVEGVEAIAAGEDDGEVADGPDGRSRSGCDAVGAAAAFDALYTRHVRPLTRQTFLLTGHRGLAESAVRRAFHTAWERWPEVAVDRDPAGWVRACSHEYALSPWNRLRPGHHSPETYAGLPEDKECLDALLSLPPCYRRTLLLHDGIGLGLAETAAESEASTPATAGRLVHAREALAGLLPEVDGTPPEQRGELIGGLLRRVAAAQPVRTVPARIVRTGSERQSRRWIVAACGLTVAMVAATSFTVATTESGTLIPQVLPAALQQLSR
ncbi:RNA polymerase subunit sigma-24 [Streptomyces sp. 549]|uniref:RNA polymerase subunit sigma-24 n=1 Tax=Streptomyces sp. 549 TaxID=3049076 RepID=UPI0024C39BBB|nr:RNA polymerase subunit sigma-24 [Streptomyces sp. 549]MDK1472782.1 RNA polymerase subunit sigma-24 [Streptomyces sp. 549]